VHRPLWAETGKEKTAMTTLIEDLTEQVAYTYEMGESCINILLIEWADGSKVYRWQHLIAVHPSSDGSNTDWQLHSTHSENYTIPQAAAEAGFAYLALNPAFWSHTVK